MFDINALLSDIVAGVVGFFLDIVWGGIVGFFTDAFDGPEPLV